MYLQFLNYETIKIIGKEFSNKYTLDLVSSFLGKGKIKDL